MQDGEGEKQKSYLARCRLPCPVTDAMLAQLSSMKDVVLQQTTPGRVEHRRAMLVMPLAILQTSLCQHLMNRKSLRPSMTAIILILSTLACAA